jgi:competence protein ComEA
MTGNMDLNSVNQTDLENIQGVGKDNAKKIVEFRQKNGTFKSWDDLKNIPGYSTEMVNALKRRGFHIAGKVA